MLGHLHAKMGDGFDYRNGVADRDVLLRHFLVDFLIYRTDDRETNVKTIAALREADAFSKKNATLAELGVDPKLYDGGKLGAFAPGGALKEETDEPFDGDFSEAVVSAESIYGSRDESVAETLSDAVTETAEKSA